MSALLLLITIFLLSSTPEIRGGPQHTEKYSFLPEKTNVTIYNNIGPGESVTIHCRSKDDDLKEHVLYYNQGFRWRFRNHFLDKTLYFCGFTTRYGSGRYDIYESSRDYSLPIRRCNLTCNWSVRKDGVHGYTQVGNIEDLHFPWEK
ncbi:Plant self-incompatibility protein S1 family [Euphorbia peplus]|nr:Plant self-incompatibility protein S1 family [Euphorbia peplus]